MPHRDHSSSINVLCVDSPAYAKNYANIDLKAAAAQVDFLTIDGYDYAGQSSGSRGGIAVSCAGEPPRGGVSVSH
jgi:hypothetical protein